MIIFHETSFSKYKTNCGIQLRFRMIQSTSAQNKVMLQIFVSRALKWIRLIDCPFQTQLIIGFNKYSSAMWTCCVFIVMEICWLFFKMAALKSGIITIIMFIRTQSTKTVINIITYMYQFTNYNVAIASIMSVNCAWDRSYAL